MAMYWRSASATAHPPRRSSLASKSTAATSTPSCASPSRRRDGRMRNCRGAMGWESCIARLPQSRRRRMKILFLSEGGPTQDYLRDCVFHGLRTLFGPDVVDVHRLDSMYQ